MKFLVTGASGFIGGKIVEMLARDSLNEILATGRTHTNRFEGYLNVKYFTQNLIADIPLLHCDACIHCAGLADDQSTWNSLRENNIDATGNLIKSLQDCRFFLFISSASVYDFSDGKYKKEGEARIKNSLSLYGKSKLESEKIVLDAGIESIYIIRPRAVYGPGDRVLLPRIHRLIKGNRMFIPGKLSRETSLTHIDNLCEAVEKSIRQKLPGKHIFNIADKTPYNLNLIFKEIMIQKTGRNSTIRVPARIISALLFLMKYLKLRGGLTEQSINYLSQTAVLDLNKAITHLEYSGFKNFYDNAHKNQLEN